MRRFLIYWFGCIIVLGACQQKKHALPVKNWNDYRKAYNFLGHQDDSAFFYFNRIASISRDTQQTTIAYNVMAGLQSSIGDYYGAEENLSAALRFLDPNKQNDHYSLAMAYNGLGMISSSLKRYDEAIKFYDLGLTFAHDTVSRPIITSNEGNAYQLKGDYTKALKLYDAVSKITERNTADYARILTNIAITKWMKNKHYNAAPELLEALKIRLKSGDKSDVNSSYRHLAEFYSKVKPDSALYFARKNVNTAVATQNADYRLEALAGIISVERPSTAQQYFLMYKQLNDSLQTARNSAKNQFAFIKYSAEKQKAEFLKLQKDNDLKRYQLAKQNILLVSLGLVFLLITSFTIYWYNKRKHEAVQQSKLQLSKKVHDVVANGLYRVMQEIDNQDDFDREPIVDRLNTLYERSRDISYDDPVLQNDDFQEKIRRLITAFASQQTNIAIVGNERSFWAKTSNTTKNELLHILQEWMVNMKKHSQATNVAIRFATEERKLLIIYTDNGVGFCKHISYGNGLRNTENRIKSFKGTLTFDTDVINGAKIRLTFPAV